MNHVIKMMIYGDPGIGKTVFTGTAMGVEELSPALLLNFESGVLSISSKIQNNINPNITIEEILTPAPRGKIKSVKIHSMDQMVAILNALYDEEHPYKCVIIDSLSEMNYVNLGEAVNKNVKNNTGVPQIGDYGSSAIQMRKLVRYFRDLPIHVIFTALAIKSKDDFTGQVSIGPSLTGKLSYEIPALLDVVGYLTIDKIEGEMQRVVYFQPTGIIEAKDRSEGGKLGDYLVNPSLGEIFGLLNSGEDQEDDEEEIVEEVVDPATDPNNAETEFYQAPDEVVDPLLQDLVDDEEISPADAAMAEAGLEVVDLNLSNSDTKEIS